ncbi:unnamed protein product [Candidula unifasciata]|uniref:UbiA prenyltransferase domain-containing protein 1 n=1 Tax=Candidula unifasciata TaxID=100452 RepID=A0A8S3YU64_9EUPU|nr:unnamed protein product [Candidula unifasciata]
MEARNSSNFHQQSQDVSSNENVQTRIKPKLSDLVTATRPWSFTASLIPVALGVALAYKLEHVFSLSIFLATVVIVVSVHAAGNLINTYVDFNNSVDNKDSDDLTLVNRILLPENVMDLALVFYVTATVGFIVLLFLSSAEIEHLVCLFLCGIVSSYVYTGGLGIKYMALGDILIFLTFGPLTVLFAYLSQTGHLSFVPLICAIPQALNIEAILHSNNARDVDSDQQARIITLAILLGPSLSYWLFFFLLFSPYFIYITVGVFYSKWLLLPLFSAMIVFSLEKDFRHGNLKLMPQKVAQLNLIMGILYVAAVLIA